jgi:hypothetical protein
MESKNTDNAEDASISQSSQSEKTVPSSIKVNVPSRKEFEEVCERRVIPKGLLAVLIAMGLVLIAGVVTVAVLLFTQPNATAAVGPAPTVSQTTQPSATPAATPEPTPSPTPVSTTAPEESDDFSSILEVPENEILSQDQ